MINKGIGPNLLRPKNLDLIVGKSIISCNRLGGLQSEVDLIVLSRLFIIRLIKRTRPLQCVFYGNCSVAVFAKHARFSSAQCYA